MSGKVAAATRVLDALRQGVTRARWCGRPVLVSVPAPVPVPAPLALFTHGRRLYTDCLYWERPADGVALVGAGAAWRIDVTGPSRVRDVRDAWRELLDGAVLAGGGRGAGPVLLGGFAFDPELPATELWSDFPAGSF